MWQTDRQTDRQADRLTEAKYQMTNIYFILNGGETFQRFLPESIFHGILKNGHLQNTKKKLTGIISRKKQNAKSNYEMKWLHF